MNIIVVVVVGGGAVAAALLTQTSKVIGDRVVGELLSSSLLLSVIECVDGRREGVMLVLFWFWKQTSNLIIFQSVMFTMNAIILSS